MDFAELEEMDGVRWSWMTWPSSRLEATRCIVPFACMYTPLKRLNSNRLPPPLQYDPVQCKACTSVLNPYCRVDLRTRMWFCIFCHHRNALPPNYSSITEQSLPYELIPDFTTVEYALPRQRAAPPAFLFVLDTCTRDDELQTAKDYIIKALSLLPPETMVGLITYGQNVHVHVIGYTDCAKCYVLRGEKEYTTEQIKDLLALPSGMPRGGAMNGVPGVNPAMVGAGRFLQPASEGEFMMTSILEELDTDPWPVPASQRPKRATCTALSVAVGILESTYAGNGARVELLVGGPGTVDPGKIVALELGDTVRSHSDIDKDNAPFHASALKAFDDIATRAVNAGHAIDVWSCSLDQVGSYEMKSCVDRTGGVFVLSESFEHPMFKNSFEKFFATDATNQLAMGFQSSLDIICSREIKIAGVIGPVASLNKDGPSVSTDMEIGIGGTTSWRMCALDVNTTIAAYFEVVNPHSNPIRDDQYRFVQFMTRYTHPSGQHRMRVTTTAGRWTAGDNIEAIAAGFDQDAAAVLMARMAVYKTENEDSFDILRWVDRMLIRLCARFAQYDRENPDSFALAENFSLYPQFMFNLRRSQFLQVFNSTPDETALYRSYLNRENVNNCLLMIQPTLMSYSLSGPPEPVLLDVTSIKPDRILLLDTFFYVIVFSGETVSAWRKAGYHEDGKHTNFSLLLQAPKDDAAAVLDERFPYARYIECDQKGSQARFLLAKLNPSVNHHSAAAEYGGSDFIFTDDVSLQVFTEHLKKLAVSSQ
ncbi:Protein transport protein SEC23 [Gracilariopsis chorda]|uniref:Protein transport protein SEC23 n=1 Tax=Gracilariopsis chorda TaxID=448386 RepID=A0A2V3IE24_9FLOR|nr:Protein transport protein SEC23 [Gracilariopsis chorda]|eukprot:PXF40314.1 Protein transport protein SEC23 [Gracilariopsis chorda]